MDAGIPLQLVQCDVDRFPVRFSHAVIPSHKGRQRHGFGRGKCGIPPGAMFDRSNRFSIFRLVCMHGPVAYQLLSGQRMLAFTQPRKFIGANRSGKSEFLR